MMSTFGQSKFQYAFSAQLSRSINNNFIHSNCNRLKSPIDFQDKTLSSLFHDQGVSSRRFSQMQIELKSHPGNLLWFKRNYEIRLSLAIENCNKLLKFSCKLAWSQPSVFISTFFTAWKYKKKEREESCSINWKLLQARFSSLPASFTCKYWIRHESEIASWKYSFKRYFFSGEEECKYFYSISWQPPLTSYRVTMHVKCFDEFQ